ncbi:MAG: hypothetical protein H0T46_20020 [Deltaproteobacteria bacterium]|nr:hypothetical protein [Deltaproteobacteria bacterium]
MRNTYFTGCLLALAAGTTGCKWSEFDDLEGDTWVTSTDKPNGDSTDYGLAIARGQRGPNGGKLVVIGAGQAQYTELVYSPDGSVDLAPTAQKLNSQFGIGNLDPQPILLADPASDEVSLVVNSGGQSIAVLTGAGGLIAHQVFGPMEPEAATYLVPPPNTVQPTPPSQVLVASMDKVYGAFVANTPNPQPSCALVDDAAMSLRIRALGAARLAPSTSDDVLVWGDTGSGGNAKLQMYPGSVFAGCATPQIPLVGWTAATTTFAPAKGSHIVMIGSTHALLVGHKELGNSDSYLALFRIDASAKTFSLVGAPVTIPELRTAAIYEEGTKKFVVAGYPTTVVDGVKSGRVLVFPLDLTTGIGDMPAMTLHDASADDEQQFGRAIAVIPFNGRQVIAVGADNEIFTYFKTSQYEETRTGR